MMPRRIPHLLIISWCLAVCVEGAAPASRASDGGGVGPPRRPNVLIIFPDQLRWCSLGCYGDQVIRSPNIDRLAAGGVRFTQAFSNFPVCSPARSVLLSGRYARSNGVTRNQDQEAGPGRPTNPTRTLAEALSAAGYETALIGKWHLAPTPQTLGFKTSLRANMRHRYYHQTYRRDEGEPYVADGYGPEHETEAAVAFLRQHRERPFFLWLTYGPPHMPLAEMPEAYKRMYDPARVPLRENVRERGQLAFDETWFKTYLWDFQYYQHKDTFQEPIPAGMDLRGLTAWYYGQITAVDDCIGRVLGALRESGREQYTIVLLTSNHGDLLGSHQLFNKGRHYDEAIRVPLIVRWPVRLKSRVVSTQVASLVDVAPTLLDLCGVPLPEGVQGASLAPVIDNTAAKTGVGENAAFIETNTADGIRTARHLYTVDHRNPRREELFDLEKDPFEMDNLAAEPRQRATLESLRARVRGWQERTPALKADASR